MCIIIITTSITMCDVSKRGGCGGGGGGLQRNINIIKFILRILACRYVHMTFLVDIINIYVRLP